MLLFKFWTALAAEYFKRRCICHCQTCLHESSDTVITEVLSPFFPSLLLQISKQCLQYYNCIYVDLKRTAFFPQNRWNLKTTPQFTNLQLCNGD